MKTKANLKAYRTNKQRKQFTDGRVTVELKTNNLFQSHIKWNPDFLEELNVREKRLLKSIYKITIGFSYSNITGLIEI